MLPRGSLHRDPKTGEVYRLVERKPGQSRDGKWDMGHIDRAKYSKELDKYLSAGGSCTPEQFKEWFQDASNYTVQDPRRNRSHIDE